MGPGDDKKPLSRALRNIGSPERDLEDRRAHADLKANLFGTPKPTVRVGRFDLTDKLGAGGMGTVYGATDRQTKRRVAVKILQSPDPELRSRLHREARAMSRLAHPNVVGILEIGPFEDGVYLAMELIDGVTLATWLSQPREPSEVLLVFAQAGGALAAAHSIGIVHRDFKPENVMVDADGHVTLLDFGLAKPAPRAVRAAAALSGFATRLTRTGVMVGTPGYMAPEQILGGAVDGRTDQFAFCVALYQALFGSRPFEGDSPEAIALAVIRGQRRAPPSDADVSAHLAEAVMRGLSLDPDDRFASMQELVDTLTEAPLEPESPGAIGRIAGALLGLGRKR